MNKKNLFGVPILFIIFRRKDTAIQVIDAIAKVKPRILYISQDGPRNKEEEKEVLETRKVVLSRINWDCDLKTTFNEKNLGCKLAVSGAIDWFFKNVEEGIILEDDCLPNPSFFGFCEEMLDLYRNDDQIMCISGDNFLPEKMQKENGYYFSKYVPIWGWATWKSAWEKYNVNMDSWKEVKNDESFNSIFSNLIEKIYWNIMFNAVYKGKIDTWDYQWLFAIWNNNGLSVNPGMNLIKNIGFDSKGSHVNTNTKLVVNNNQNIKHNPILMDRSFSKKVDDYIAKHFFRISIPMVIMQFIYLKFLK